MRLLLDENTPRDLAVALRNEGHDVVWVPETADRSAPDARIWQRAIDEERTLVTADLGFPLPGRPPPGIIILRHFDRVSTAALTALLLDAIKEQGDAIGSRLLVLSPGRVRVRDL
jgi:predicted nuclease of predicted toxin-antitoxin system